MTCGQYMAGMSFGNGGLGLVHSMAHPLGTVFRLGHGICNALLLPYVCRFNMQAAKDRYVGLTRSLYPEAGNMSKTKQLITLLSSCSVVPKQSEPRSRLRQARFSLVSSRVIGR